MMAQISKNDYTDFHRFLHFLRNLIKELSLLQGDPGNIMREETSPHTFPPGLIGGLI
jgi:hypothetical protein